MKKIIFSLAVIIGVGAIVIGATTAYFSDTEVSTGNTFTAGDIDLEIDNTSYYNGEMIQELTWGLRDIDGDMFYNFGDLKPGDEGEDTISIHTGSNESWLCMEVTLTETNENGITEPEGEDGDVSMDVGELQDEIEVIFWNDDGDNVLEDDETVFSSGLMSELGILTLADSTGNVWSTSTDPLAGDTTAYIGNAWCFGDLTEAPVAQGDNDPTVDPGIICDGSLVGNQSQTDDVIATVSFSSVQARHNDSHVCEQPDT